MSTPTLSQVEEPLASPMDEFELIAKLDNLYNMAKDKKQQYLAML